VLDVNKYMNYFSDMFRLIAVAILRTNFNTKEAFLGETSSPIVFDNWYIVMTGNGNINIRYKTSIKVGFKLFNIDISSYLCFF